MNCAVHVSLRAADGRVRHRESWIWPAPPPARVVLQRLAAAAVRARRGGLVVQVDHAPDGFAALVELAGLSTTVRVRS